MRREPLAAWQWMRRPTYHSHQRGRLDVEMTPMIDVIFLLLIFFVCTASFQAVEEILPTNLSLPGSIVSDAPIDPEVLDLEEVVVRIFRREGRLQWQVNQQDCGRLKEVRDKLAAVARVKVDLPVILDVDSDVPLENMIDVYDLCRQIGLERVQFAASDEV